MTIDNKELYPAEKAVVRYFDIYRSSRIDIHTSSRECYDASGDAVFVICHRSIAS